MGCTLEFIQLCAVSPALVCLAITAMEMCRRWQRSSKMHWKGSARGCCRKAQTKKNPTAASRHNPSLCRYKLIKRVFHGCRNQSSFQPSASRWGGWSTLSSVQGRASLGICTETAVMSWDSAKSKPWGEETYFNSFNKQSPCHSYGSTSCRQSCSTFRRNFFFFNTVIKLLSSHVHQQFPWLCRKKAF